MFILKREKSSAITGKQSLFLSFQEAAVARLECQFIAQSLQDFLRFKHRWLAFLVRRHAKAGGELVIHHFRHSEIAPA